MWSFFANVVKCGQDVINMRVGAVFRTLGKSGSAGEDQLGDEKKWMG